jgi:hypothetical protein
MTLLLIIIYLWAGITITILIAQEPDSAGSKLKPVARAVLIITWPLSAPYMIVGM